MLNTYFLTQKRTLQLSLMVCLGHKVHKKTFSVLA